MVVSEGTCCSGAGGASRTFSFSLPLVRDCVIPATRKQTLGKCPLLVPSLSSSSSLHQPVPWTEALWYSDGGAFDHEPKGQI